MKTQIVLFVAFLTIVSEISANCGCLKCNKNLQVISPPNYPYKVIVNNPEPIPYRSSCLARPKVELLEQICPPVYAYRYQVQQPVIVPPPVPPTLTGLTAKPDRVVLQGSKCPCYIEDGSCGGSEPLPPPCALPLIRGLQVVQVPPTLEVVGPNPFSCDCRYGHRRKKRDLPTVPQSVRFFLRLLPAFLRVPLESFLLPRSQPSEILLRRKGPPLLQRWQGGSETLLEKLQKVNGRTKRSLLSDSQEMTLPFLRVTEIENEVEDESEEEREIVGRVNSRKEFLEPFNFNQMLPYNPIYYLLNAPIRILHHFHRLGQQISPVFKSVPQVLVNSRRFLRNMGKNFKNDVMSFASELIGDFDGLDPRVSRYVRPRRFRRDVGPQNVTRRLQYEPEYTLVFGNQNENSIRRKRYILKVVDEDEVAQFLTEKLGGIVEPPPPPPTKKKEKDGKKKLVVEQLSSKVIIDNKGRPFVEIGGMKRPLFLNRKPQEEHEEVANPIKKIKRPLFHTPQSEPKEDEDTDVKERINSIILQARQRMDHNSPIVGDQQYVPTQMIKDRVNQILTEVQDLINIDFDKYSTIHGDLRKLESFKQLLVSEWKKLLMENKANDIPSKIRLLDDFKELQILRDKAVEEIAATLSSGSNFMTKKLIKMLVRLQKLQCIIYRVVEDFEERIKMGTDFDVKKEIRYVDYLADLHFVVGRTKHDLEEDLRKERDAALQNEMKVLDSLRKMMEENQDNTQKLYEEAHILWEIKNIDKLQKDTIIELNTKISRGQKVRKELKILFDLLRQFEHCEEKQQKLLHAQTKEVPEVVPPVEEVVISAPVKKNAPKRKRPTLKNFRNRRFPHKTILEDKRPIKLVSNGYSMTAYKVSDGFD